MKRRHRKRRRKNYKKLIIPAFIVLVSILTIGYSAFQTNISLSVRGNIVEKSKTTFQILSNIEVQSNNSTVSGLYKEDNNYIYKGDNPHNYISLEKAANEDSLYRIISFNKETGEDSYSLKVIKNKALSSAFSWDSYKNRANTGGFCNYGFGCKIWGSSQTMMDSNENIITKMPRELNGTEYDLPDQEASLNVYLNNEWYNSLPNNIKKYIIKHLFNVGYGAGNSQNEIKQHESDYKWRGYIGLMALSEYYSASTATLCPEVTTGTGFHDSYTTSTYCKNNNWLYKPYYQWTITPDTHVNGYSSYVYYITDYGSAGSSGYEGTGACSGMHSIHPVFYLSSDLVLTGKGTETDPYIIEGFNKDTNN